MMGANPGAAFRVRLEHSGLNEPDPGCDGELNRRLSGQPQGESMWRVADMQLHKIIWDFRKSRGNKSHHI